MDDYSGIQSTPCVIDLLRTGINVYKIIRFSYYVPTTTPLKDKSHFM